MSTGVTLPNVSSHKAKRIHALQAQVFLDASDEVDIDEEIAEDILQGFDGYLIDGEEEVDIGSGKERSETCAADVHDHEGDDWQSGDSEGDSWLDTFEGA